jgi:ankyrin repeat protein
MGECMCTGFDKQYSGKEKVHNYIDSFSCSKQIIKYPEVTRAGCSYLQSSFNRSVKNKKVIPSTYPPERQKEQYYQSSRFGPIDYLEKLFCLCGCTLKTEIAPLPEVVNIFSELKRLGNRDSEDYLWWLNENNESSLEVAINADNKVMVGIFLEMGDEYVYSEAFLAACRKGNKEIIHLLLESGSQANLDMHTQADCILFCVKHGYTYLLNILHRAGFCLTSTQVVRLKSPKTSKAPLLWIGQTDGSLLHVAAGYGHHRIVEYLINQGSNIESFDSSGWRPVHLAVQGGSHCLRVLLRAGVDIEAGDNEGRSPLFLAASIGNFLAVKLLVEKGAEVDTVNEEGMSALVAAASCNHDVIVKYLLEKGATFKGLYPNKLQG